MDLIAKRVEFCGRKSEKKIKINNSKAGLGLGAEVQQLFFSFSKNLNKKKKKLKTKHERVWFCLECVHLETVIDRFYPACVNQLLNWALPYNVTHPPSTIPNATKIPTSSSSSISPF